MSRSDALMSCPERVRTVYACASSSKEASRPTTVRAYPRSDSTSNERSRDRDSLAVSDEGSNGEAGLSGDLDGVSLRTVSMRVVIVPPRFEGLPTASSQTVPLLAISMFSLRARGAPDTGRGRRWSTGSSRQAPTGSSGTWKQNETGRTGARSHGEPVIQPPAQVDACPLLSRRLPIGTQVEQDMSPRRDDDHYTSHMTIHR